MLYFLKYTPLFMAALRDSNNYTPLSIKEKCARQICGKVISQISDNSLFGMRVLFQTLK